MAVRPFGTGYDPNSGWPPDDSTNVPWDSDVDLSGYGRFGGGGFLGNPKLTGPVTGSYGKSLSGPGLSDSLTARAAPVANPYGAGMPRGTGPQFYGPRNPPLRNPPAVRTGPGPYTDATINPNTVALRNAATPPNTVALRNAATPPNAATPSSAAAEIPQPGMFDRIAGLLSGRATPIGMGLAGAGIVGEGIQNEREGADQGLINPHGTGPQYSVSNLPLSPNGPLPGPGRRPSGPAALPYESGFPTPISGGDPRIGEGAGVGPMNPNPPGTTVPTPIGSPAPAMPPVRPRVAPAGPAAAQQQPNLGNYAPIYQPNIARTGNVRGGRSGDDNAPLMGAPDWSRLFGRQP